MPHPQEFVDAAVFIGGLHGIQAVPHVVPKLRDIYVKTGKTPIEVAEAAQKDPTVRQDLLAENKVIPGAFAEETLNRLKAGEEVPTDELLRYREQAWAQATLNERAGPEAIKRQLESLADKAVRGEGSSDRTAWGFVGNEEAAALSGKTQLDIQSGYSHTVDVSSMRHALKEHGTPETELPRGQLPITAEDLMRIPEVVRDHDAVVYVGKNKLGRDVIQYTKVLDAETVMVVEEVRTKRNQLAFQTMYKRKTTDSVPPPLTSETLRGMRTTSSAGTKTSGLSEMKDTTSTAEVKADAYSQLSPEDLRRSEAAKKYDAANKEADKLFKEYEALQEEYITALGNATRGEKPQIQRKYEGRMDAVLKEHNATARLAQNCSPHAWG